MRRFIIALGLVAGVLGTVDTASAANCTYGYDGVMRCSEGGQIYHAERPAVRRYYEERAYQRGGYYDGGPRYRYRDGRRSRDPNAGCPPHYTVQDGVCKPYRGY